MLHSILDAANLHNCGETNEIFEKSEDNDVLVDCKPGYGGANCLNVTNICLAQDPCFHDAGCRLVGDTKYKCDCPLGFTGDLCQYSASLDFTANFKGDGYLELNRAIASPDLDASKISFGIALTTNQSNGLLFWFGQEKGEAFTGQDYLAGAIVDGYVEFAFRLNSEEAIVRNLQARVDDNERHTIYFKRDGFKAQLEVDSFNEHGESRPTEKLASHLPGNVFLGMLACSHFMISY